LKTTETERKPQEQEGESPIKELYLDGNSEKRLREQEFPAKSSILTLVKDSEREREF